MRQFSAETVSVRTDAANLYQLFLNPGKMATTWTTSGQSLNEAHIHSSPELGEGLRAVTASSENMEIMLVMGGLLINMLVYWQLEYISLHSYIYLCMVNTHWWNASKSVQINDVLKWWEDFIQLFKHHNTWTYEYESTGQCPVLWYAEILDAHPTQSWFSRHIHVYVQYVSNGWYANHASLWNI